MKDVFLSQKVYRFRATVITAKFAGLNVKWQRFGKIPDHAAVSGLLAVMIPHRNAGLVIFLPAGLGKILLGPGKKLVVINVGNLSAVFIGRNTQGKAFPVTGFRSSAIDSLRNS